MLLAAGVDLNASDEEGWGAPHHAARRGRQAFMARLVEAGVDNTQHNNHGATPLVSLQAHSSTAALPPDSHPHPHPDCLAIWHAPCQAPAPGNVPLEVCPGADAAASAPPTLQHWAAAREGWEEIDYMDPGLPPTPPGAWGAVVDQFLAAGAPVDAVDCEGETPLCVWAAGWQGLAGIFSSGVPAAPAEPPLFRSLACFAV